MEDMSFLRALGALLVVIALVLLLGWGLRRFSSFPLKTGAQGDLEVLSWKPLDARRKLTIVRWGGEEHLLLLGQTNDLHISRRPHVLDVEPEDVETAIVETS